MKKHLDNWDKNWFSNYRATRGISSSFPTGTKMKRFNQQSEYTKQLLLHLLLSMRHVLEKKDLYYTRLSMNDPATEPVASVINSALPLGCVVAFIKVFPKSES